MYMDGGGDNDAAGDADGGRDRVSLYVRGIKDGDDTDKEVESQAEMANGSRRGRRNRFRGRRFRDRRFRQINRRRRFRRSRRRSRRNDSSRRNDGSSLPRYWY